MLGIDAAWTSVGSSGVALVAEHGDIWSLLALEDSYHRFHSLASGRDRGIEKFGSIPDAPQLLASAKSICGRSVDLVAVDMPLALSPIVGRRHADNVVSQIYGGSRWASTHSPSAGRPGAISDVLRGRFFEAGYELQTSSAIVLPGLIEVYPHPAIMELCNEYRRLPYKFGNRRKYWPQASEEERRENILHQWHIIVSKLSTYVENLMPALEFPAMSANSSEWKAFEDRLDAIVCAWVAIEVLSGHATLHGDEDSAIWNPLQTNKE